MEHNQGNLLDGGSGVGDFLLCEEELGGGIDILTAINLDFVGIPSGPEEVGCREWLDGMNKGC